MDYAYIVKANYQSYGTFDDVPAAVKWAEANIVGPYEINSIIKVA